MELSYAHALLIGTGGRDIPQTATDARDIADILRDPKLAGYPPGNITLLCERDATKEKIMEALDRLIDVADAHPDETTLLIYFSGHGGQLSSEDGKSYFMITNHRLEDSASNDEKYLRGETFCNRINQINAARLIVLLDCCFAGSISDSSALDQPMPTAKPGLHLSNEHLLTRLIEGTGRLFMSSCADDEKSLILRGDRNSIFTKYILESLRGLNSRYQEVSVMELIEHVCTGTYREVEAIDARGKRQTPEISSAAGVSYDFFVCRNGLFDGEGTARRPDNAEFTDKSAEFLEKYPHKKNYRKDLSIIRIKQFTRKNVRVHFSKSINRGLDGGINKRTIVRVYKDMLIGELKLAIEKLLELYTITNLMDLEKVKEQAHRYNQMIKDDWSGKLSERKRNLRWNKILFATARLLLRMNRKIRRAGISAMEDDDH